MGVSVETDCLVRDAGPVIACPSSLTSVSAALVNLEEVCGGGKFCAMFCICCTTLSLCCLAEICGGICKGKVFLSVTVCKREAGGSA